MSNYKFKSKVQADAGVSLPQETASRALQLDGSGNIQASAVTNTELDLLSGATVDLADTEQAVADLTTLTGVAANSTTLGTFTGTIIPDGSDIKEALQELETAVESLPDPITYQGTWNASTNTPTLSNSDTGVSGYLYQVTVAGTVDFGAGNISFEVGDKVVNNGTIWEKWDMTDAVASVNGQTGVVVLDSDDISEGVTNLYFTDERAQDAVGTILVDTATVDLVYTDATPSIAANVITQLSVTSDASGVKLVNDASTPGNSYYYGTDGSGTKGYFTLPTGNEPGDIPTTSFTGADGQASPANVTGFAFANGVVRSFNASATVIVDATTDAYETFQLYGVQKGASWDLSISSTGDDSQVAFSITNAGQIQYTGATYTGFSSLTIKFRAWVIGV
jgi:hypothetical protein